MSLCPDTTPSSSAAMPEQSADVSSTPLHAHAVSWVSTSSTTCRMYSTGQPLCLPVQAPKHTEISSQIDGRKNSRANHPAFFILMTRNRGDAYRWRAVDWLASGRGRQQEGNSAIALSMKRQKRLPILKTPGHRAQKPRFCARNARKRGFRKPKNYRNPDFVLEMPQNRGSKGQKRTKTGSSSNLVLK